MSAAGPLPARGPAIRSAFPKAARPVLKRPLIVWPVPIAAAVLLLYQKSYPWYDSAVALAAAQDLIEGREVAYQFADQPAFHPVTSLAALALAPFGTTAEPILVAGMALAFGVMCAAVFRAGRILFNTPIGLLAAAIVFTSVSLQTMAARAYGDIAFGALIAVALVLELERPRRGLPVLGLLALAGLHRPEAWLLALLYAAYLFRGRDWRARAGLGLLVLAAPVAWLALDLVLVGERREGSDAVSLHLDLLRGMWDVPLDIPALVSQLTRRTVVIGAAIGLALTLVSRPLRSLPSMRLVLGLALASVIALMGIGALGQPVANRYAIALALVAAIFCAAAALGWMRLGGDSVFADGESPSSARRRLATASGLFVIALLVFTLAKPLDSWRDARADIDANGRAWDHLRALVTSERVKESLSRCRPLYTPSPNAIPYLRFALNVPVGDVALTAPNLDFANGLHLVPTADLEGAGFLYSPGFGPPSTAAPPDTALMATSFGWRIFQGRSCGRES